MKILSLLTTPYKDKECDRDNYNIKKADKTRKGTQEKK